MLSKKIKAVTVIFATVLLGSAVATTAVASSNYVYSFTNDHRANNNMPALTLNGKLSASAQSWSEQMSKTGNLAHNPNRLGAENVGMSCGAGKDRGLTKVMNALVASPGHNENMLANHKNIGVGYVYDTDTDCTWVTQVFTGTGGGSSQPSTSSPKQESTKSNPKQESTKSKPAAEKDVKDYSAWATIALNVRSGPGTGYKVTGSLTKNEKVTVKAENSSGTWGRIGDGRWVSKHYLSTKAPSKVSPSKEAPTENKSPESKQENTAEIQAKERAEAKAKTLSSNKKEGISKAKFGYIETVKLQAAQDFVKKINSSSPGDYFILNQQQGGINLVAYINQDSEVLYVFTAPRTWMIPQ